MSEIITQLTKYRGIHGLFGRQWADMTFSLWNLRTVLVDTLQTESQYPSEAGLSYPKPLANPKPYQGLVAAKLYTLQTLKA